MKRKGDLDAQSLAIFAGIFYSFDLAKFDDWLAGIAASAAKEELTTRRAAAVTAMSQNRLDIVRGHLELLKVGQIAIPLIWKNAAYIAQKKDAAKKPRQKSPMKTQIKRVMRAYKNDAVSFKSFMAAWKVEPMGGLRLTEDKATQRYTVADENGDLGTASYKWRGLEEIYGQ